MGLLIFLLIIDLTALAILIAIGFILHLIFPGSWPPHHEHCSYLVLSILGSLT